MNWSNLPPLSALRAFEATARQGSFSAAARELNVTHAAIAQQVRGLETFLDASLAFREGRGIALTEDGAALAAGLTTGFEAMADAVAMIQSRRADQPLRVTLTPSFAAKWLMPRLADFWAKHPEVPLSLHPDRAVIDLRSSDMDLAIRFGAGDWPGVDADCILAARNVIVAAPALLKGSPLPTLAQMRDMPWILENSWQDQFHWLDRLGLLHSDLNAMTFDTAELARAAAHEGFGLHVDLDLFIRADLDRGDLVEVYSEDVSKSGFYLVTRPGRVNPRLRQFTSWLKSVVR